MLRLLLILPLLILTACEGNVRQKLGLSTSAPDEFMVARRAPLEIPDNLNYLPPPTPGAQRPQEQTVAASAQEALFGRPLAKQGDGFTPAEAALLNKTGAPSANPDIRAQVDYESTQIDKTQVPVVKRLLNIGKDEPLAEVVDAEAEAKRIQENKAQGVPLNEGKTPTVVK